MKNLFLILVLTALVATSGAQGRKSPGDQRLAGLDTKFQSLLADWKTPGFAVAIVEKDKVIYARGFGYRDYEKKIAVTPHTLFAIGSCTKAFTSSLLGILMNENKVDPGKSPETYLPELKFFNHEMDNSITIRDMMCHRTGLPRHDYSWYLFPTGSRDSLMKRIRYQQPSAGVREKFQYNNFMFMLQGLIVERITGTTWEENIKERLFSPLGMSESDLSVGELGKSGDAALGYRLRGDTAIEKVDYYAISGMAPAGSINSSVSDMAKWVITWINGGKYEGTEIIPATYVSEAESSQMVASAGLPSKENPDIYLSNYGYGWFLSSYRGHYQVQHGGAIDGFSALTSFFPSDSIGIIVLVNQDGSYIPSIVRNIAADHMLKLPETDWSKKMKKEHDAAIKSQKEAESNKISDRIPGTVPSHKLSEFSGDFVNQGYGTIKIAATGDSLFAYLPLKKIWLRHYHYDIFEPFEVTRAGIDTTDKIDLRFNFHTGDKGDIGAVIIKMEPAADPIEFIHQDAFTVPDMERIKDYSGEYAIGTIVARIYTKTDNTLYLFVPGQPEYELIPAGTNKFTIKMLQGYSVEFVEDSNRKIDGMLFIQPNGIFRAVKK